MTLKFGSVPITTITYLINHNPLDIVLPETGRAVFSDDLTFISTMTPRE